MNRFAVALLGVSLVLLPAAAGAREAPDKPIAATLTGQTRQDFLDGVALLETGDHPHALSKLRRAYETSKNPRILWNIALCHERMHKYVLARDALQRYLKETRAAGVLTAKDEADAQAFIQSFGRLIGRLRLDVSEGDVVVTVDGETVASNPLDVDEGEHQVQISKEGFRPWSTVAHVDAQGEAVVTAKLLPLRHEGRLVVTAPPGAMIRLDGKVMGTGTIAVTTASGLHHLSVSAPERRTRDLDVTVVDDDVRNIELSLERESKPAGSRLGIWPWLATGGLVVAGAIVTGVVLANSGDSSTRTPTTSLGSTSVP